MKEFSQVMPTISVITPAYNAEHTILETIESVQQQTFQDFEFIIINDGSTDKTLEVIETVNDGRLKVFSYSNGGVCTARNRGISHATGEYIAFLDADDLWTPDKLELQLKALQQNPEAGAAYSWTYFMYKDKDSARPGKPVHYTGNIYPYLLTENFLCHGSNPLVRRSIVETVGEFDSNFPHCADWDYYLRLALHTSFVLVPKHQIYYRQSTTSMTSKVSSIEKQILSMLEKTFKNAPPEYQHLKNRSMAWSYEYCVQQYLEYGKTSSDIQQASQKLWKAFCLYPPIILDDYAQSLSRWLVKRWLLSTFPYLNFSRST